MTNVARHTRVLLRCAVVVALIGLSLSTAGGWGAATEAPPGPNNTFVWASRVMDKTNPLLDMDLDRVPLWTFDGLVSFDGSLEPHGALAQSWDVSNGGKTYVFHLRKGVTWHDGQPFTADDVVFTVQAALDPKNKSYMAPAFMVAGKPVTVTKVDADTVRFDLPQPSNTFLFMMWRQNSVIVPKHLLAGVDLQTTPFDLKPIGTGPYMVVKYVPKQQVILKANPNYFGGAPKIQYWVFKELEDQNAALAALGSGEVTAAGLGGKAALTAAAKMPHVKIHGYDAGWIFALVFNVRRAPLNDKSVRQAVAYAINRQQLVKTIAGADTTVATSLIGPPGTWQYDAGVTTYGFNPAKAKALLAQDGWKAAGGGGVLEKAGKPLTLTISIQARATDSDPMPFAVAIQKELSDVGFKVNIVQLDRASLQPKLLNDHDFDAYLWWDGYSFVPDVSAFWLTKSADPTGYASPRLDALIDKANTTPDRAARKATLDEIAQQVAGDVPMIPLYYYRGHVGIQDVVGGVPQPSGADPNNTGIFYRVQDLTLNRH
ncbi:MAG TPA: ABC transporter substrate-binding protein [bacterium]|nr:ABC transporter substrate-binding protein [bacterium]